MPKSRARYAPEYRRRMVELVRAGRSPDDLAKEFEPIAQSIRNRVAQAERDAGRLLDGLTSEERQELSYLAVVLDAFSRRIVGRAMETHLRTQQFRPIGAELAGLPAFVRRKQSSAQLGSSMALLPLLPPTFTAYGLQSIIEHVAHFPAGSGAGC